MPLVYATELGTLVRLEDDPPWDQVVEELVHQLDADHHRGTISAGDASFGLVTTLLDAPPVPVLTVAWTMDPPVTRGPFYDSGQPRYRWGVPDDVTRTVLDQAVSWVQPDAGEAFVTQGAYPVAVSASDAAEVFEESLQRFPSTATTLAAVHPIMPTAGLHLRALTLSAFGVGTWGRTAVTGHAAAALDLASIARGMASQLDVAFVRPMFPAQLGGSSYLPPQWRMGRAEWSEKVPDANGIQLLTGAHLERASNLDDWIVTRVATDRFLVQARDLDRWYYPLPSDDWAAGDYPDAEMVRKARSDFGAMILGA
ncbi:hypothetical protein [Terrabacter sp. Ter38]|uniref:hypothetical protein n=1 Tax=Terrabacter sp. Ter38 TaxID=2926030 RepID=UPI0021189215|nr:hypothetical protein [Terrabacter sp. Ter38]